MARLRLKAGAEDAIGLLGLGDRLHRRGEFIEIRRRRDLVLLEDILAVHGDEDRDIERDAGPFAVVKGETLDQRLGEVVEVEARHREIGLVLVILDRIDRILREGRDPGLVEIIDVIGAELALDVLRRLGEHLLQRHDLDFDIDAGRVGKLTLDLVEHDRRRCRFRGVAHLGALELAADIFQPLGRLFRRLRHRRIAAEITTERPRRAEEARGEGREADACHAGLAQEVALGDPPCGEVPRGIDDEGLLIVFFETH